MIPFAVAAVLLVVGAALGTVGTLAYIVTEEKDGEDLQKRYDKQRDE